MINNFTLQEILGSLIGFLLFPLVLVIPGYVIGWLLNLFDFRSRLLPVRFLIALVLSNAIIPIVLYLSYYFVSDIFAIAILCTCLIAWVIILIASRKNNTAALSPEVRRHLTIAILMGGAWVIFTIFCLVDLQIGDKLYFNSVSYDYTTRVAMIDAMTRTGVPPINPSYYPGHPEKLTFLYFFWYILASVIDKIGGSWVNAQAALIASVAWCGLCLMATIALYLRIRNKISGIKIWQLSIFAFQLLLISGLDFIPVMALLVKAKTTWGHLIFEGRMEGWNMPIMDWLGAIMWVPLHVSSMMACLTGLMLFFYTYNKDKKQQLIAACISGVAFASALGLSVWITFGFAMFWALWMLVLFFGEKRRQMVFFMTLTGIIALILAYPFIAGVTRTQTGTASATLPIAFYVRPFQLISAYAPPIPIIQDIVNFLLLPVNYLFELGFFFVVGLFWLERSKKISWKNSPHYMAEIILLATIAITLSFVRSTIIMINDFGIRAWLLGQFVLLIWAVDLFEHKIRKNNLSLFSVFRPGQGQMRLNNIMAIFLTIGILTTALDMVIMRTWTIMVDTNIAGFPNELSPDTQLGQRTYASRLAYDYIRDSTPENTVVQDNPMFELSRPGGLYGTRQVAISYRTAYGVPQDQYKLMVKQISPIFLSKNITSWDDIDKICDQYLINLIIVNDVDPVWSSLPKLEQKRPARYQNQYYAVLGCGSFAQTR